MKNSPYKRYFYAAFSLFCVIASSLVLFFLLFRLDEIEHMIGGIVSTLMPFIIGAVLAYIICPLCNTIERLLTRIIPDMKKKSTKEKLCLNLSVFSGILIAIVFVYILLMIVIPQLITSVIRIVQILPDTADKLVIWSQRLLASNETLLKNSQDIIDKAYNFLDNWLSNGLLEYLQNIATGLSSGVMNVVVVVMNIFIGIIVAIYILLSRKKLARQSNMIIFSVFKEKTANAILNEVKYADHVFSGFINGKILDAIIVAVICYIGMIIFRFFNTGSVTMSETLVAVIVGIFNVIPFFGWYIGLFMSAILILMVNPIQCIFFVIFDIILQQIDGNILGPKIIGNTTGISSFWVLFSILFFGDIWGIAGMLIGVPLFAVIYHCIRNFVFRGLKKKGKGEMVDNYLKDFPKKNQESQKEEVRAASENVMKHDSNAEEESIENVTNVESKDPLEILSSIESITSDESAEEPVHSKDLTESRTI